MLDLSDSFSFQRLSNICDLGERERATKRLRPNEPPYIQHPVAQPHPQHDSVNYHHLSVFVARLGQLLPGKISLSPGTVREWEELRRVIQSRSELAHIEVILMAIER